MYDVLVAGGGPAGLCAARAAAAAGAAVVLLERDSAFGVPTRTSGGSFIAPLRRLGVPAGLWLPVREARFLAPAAEAVVRFDAPVVCVLDVRALYQWLAERAAAAGAELRLRATVIGACAAADGIEVRVRQPGGEERLRARVAIDATGTAAVLGGAVGLHPPFARRAVGAEWDLLAPSHPVDACVLAFGTRLAPSGYAWSFPYRPGRVRLGVGVMRPEADADPRDLLPRARDLPHLRDWLDGAQPIEVHAGVIPVAPLRARILAGPVVLAGDAASHASQLAGEGIRYAMGAGQAAGAAAAASCAHGEGPLRDYERAWRRRHRRDFAVAWRLNRRLAGFDDECWNRAVELVDRTPPWFVARALSTDFAPMGVLRLALGHPGLAGRVLRIAATAPPAA